MVHFLLLVAFSAAVGTVLGAMLRREPRRAAILAAWIALGMIVSAVIVAWVLYLLAT